MKRFIEGESREQVTLLPEYLDDYIGEDNPVRIVDGQVGSSSPRFWMKRCISPSREIIGWPASVAAIPTNQFRQKRQSKPFERTVPVAQLPDGRLQVNGR